MDDIHSSWDVTACGVSKNYGNVRALESANLRAKFGEVHALLGENGAGKSTICKVLSGSVRPDSAELTLGGDVVSIASVTDSMNTGIGTVFQELSLIPDLSVAENLAFTAPANLRRLGLASRRRERLHAEEVFDQLRIKGIRPGQRVGELPLDQQQMVEIAKVVSRRPRVLILDEATSSLAAAEVDWLFGIVEELRSAGTAVFMISHRMGEAFELADRITVFRNGTDVSAGSIDDFTEAELVELMLGRRLEHVLARPSAPPQADTVLEVRNLASRNRFHDVDFELRRGEILGIAGLQGQGQVPLLRALAGDLRSSGEITLCKLRIRARSPRGAIRAGIALVPEDRRTEGLALEMSIRDNMSLPTLRKLRRGGLVSHRAESNFVRRLAASLSIKADSIEMDVAGLSGGNQQKVLLGKVLSLKSTVLLLVDITRGVDVGTKADIFAMIRQLSADGTGVLIYSSDATELVAMCHRVLVMHDRTITTELVGESISERNIVAAAVGGSGAAGVVA